MCKDIGDTITSTFEKFIGAGLRTVNTRSFIEDIVPLLFQLPPTKSLRADFIYNVVREREIKIGSYNSMHDKF